MQTQQLEIQMDDSVAAPLSLEASVLPDKETSDEALFERFAATACERSFAILFERHAPKIRGFIFRRIGDEQQADDLTQNVFVRILRAKDAFDPRQNFSTWSHTIASNVLKNHYRSVGRSKQQVYSDIQPRLSTKSNQKTVDPVFDAPSSLPTPDVEAFRQELKVHLRAAIARLEPGYRDIFVLHQMMGFSYERVATELDIAIGTVKSRMSKARSQVREYLSIYAQQTEGETNS